MKCYNTYPAIRRAITNKAEAGATIRVIDKNTTIDIMTFDSVYNVCCYPLATHITL